MYVSTGLFVHLEVDVGEIRRGEAEAAAAAAGAHVDAELVRDALGSLGGGRDELEAIEGKWGQKKSMRESMFESRGELRTALGPLGRGRDELALKSEGESVKD